MYCLPTGLYFIATWNQDAIFEAGMTASEFTDTEEFRNMIRKWRMGRVLEKNKICLKSRSEKLRIVN